MKCEVCGKETRINYGGSNTVVCEKCFGTEESRDLIKNSKTHQEVTDQNFNSNYDFSHPFAIGALTTLLGLIISDIMGDMIRINIFIWSIYVFFGIFTTSVALILKELKAIRQTLQRG